MGRKLILDTGTLIAIERGLIDLDIIVDDDDPAIAAVTVAELYMGLDFAHESRRPARQRFIDSVLEFAAIEDYDFDIARMHSRLMVHVRSTGRARGSHDLIIAATAAATGRTIVTTDKAAEFGGLPGVECTLISPR